MTEPLERLLEMAGHRRSLTVLGRLRYVILHSETVAMRFWMAIISLGYGGFMFSMDVEKLSLYAPAVAFLPAWAWGVMFVTSGAAMLYGVLRPRLSRITMFLESYLSIFAWCSLGITLSIPQGAPGPTLYASLIPFWLLMRYPPWHK